MSISEASEQTSKNYLKWIYILSKSQEVHSSGLADVLELSRPTVCKKLHSLECEGYLVINQNKVISLTKKGEKVARETYEKNIVFWQFLIDLGVDRGIAKRDACRLEHAVSAESFDAFKKMFQKKIGEAAFFEKEHDLLEKGLYYD